MGGSSVLAKGSNKAIMFYHTGHFRLKLMVQLCLVGISVLPFPSLPFPCPCLHPSSPLPLPLPLPLFPPYLSPLIPFLKFSKFVFAFIHRPTSSDRYMWIHTTLRPYTLLSERIHSELRISTNVHIFS